MWFISINYLSVRPIVCSAIFMTLIRCSSTLSFLFNSALLFFILLIFMLSYLSLHLFVSVNMSLWSFVHKSLYDNLQICVCMYQCVHFCVCPYVCPSPSRHACAIPYQDDLSPIHLLCRLFQRVLPQKQDHPVYLTFAKRTRFSSRRIEREKLEQHNRPKQTRQ